jgi:hypothetical protein
MKRTRILICNNIVEISEIALSGLLAVIVWFIISQGTINTNVYTLGALSLSVGLVTREIVSVLRSFAMKFVGPPQHPDSEKKT